MYTVQITLVDNDSEELVMSIAQKFEDTFMTEDFCNVLDKFNDMVEFVKANYDCEDTYELTAYILDEDGDVIH